MLAHLPSGWPSPPRVSHSGGGRMHEPPGTLRQPARLPRSLR